MREILFRGKRVDNCEWVYGNLIQMDNGSSQCFIVPFYEYASTLSCWQLVAANMIAVIHETVGQYTALRDKSGVKIFEGDILDENSYLFAVEYDSKWAKFKLQHCKKAIQYPEWNRGILMEIIGNIHDNPKLLKVED